MTSTEEVVQKNDRILDIVLAHLDAGCEHCREMFKGKLSD